MVRKLAAILVMILSALGLIFCLAVLIGAWLFNEPATSAITSLLDAADSYLNVAGQTANQVDIRLTEVQSDVESLATTSPERIAQAQQTLDLKVKPVITQVETTMSSLENTIAAANQMLVQVDRLPGIDVSSFGDELQNLDQRLAEVSDRLGELTSALADQNFDGARVAAAASAVSDKLAEVTRGLASAKARIASVRDSLTSAKATIPGMIDTISLVITLVILLLGAGQISLFMQSLKWFRVEQLETE